VLSCTLPATCAADCGCLCGEFVAIYVDVTNVIVMVNILYFYQSHSIDRAI
jgi:hypothetical protein